MKKSKVPELNRQKKRAFPWFQVMAIGVMAGVSVLGVTMTARRDRQLATLKQEREATAGRLLSVQYSVYNEKYFAGKLPRALSVTVSDAATRAGDIGYFSPGEAEIVLNPDFIGSDKILYHCLLHEMAHAELFYFPKTATSRALAQSYVTGGTGIVFSLGADYAHGDDWQTEMLRLAKAGAFKDLW